MEVQKIIYLLNNAEGEYICNKKMICHRQRIQR